MARPNEVNGTVAIKFRVSRAVYETLKSAANNAGITISEFIRGIIYYYLTETLLQTIRNENPKTLMQLREELKKEVASLDAGSGETRRRCLNLE
jgi:antitoxin component of RelBE/YafQ-DinJ toxin-antitoxin module